MRSRTTLAGSTPSPPSTQDSVLQAPAGCFVSLHNVHPRELRGCVGRIHSTDPLALTCHESAISVLHDPRFADRPVTVAQLRLIDLEISVMSPMRIIASPLDFDPKNEGIYLTCQGRSGCFLPQVARETGWTRETLLNKLCSEKLSLHEGAWRDSSAKLSTFTTTILGPEPFGPN